MIPLRRTAVIGLVLLALTSLVALGQRRPFLDHTGRPDGPRPGGPGGPPDPVLGLAGHVLHDLDLTDTQKSRIHDLIRSHVDSDLEPLIQDLFEARHDLEILVWNPDASDKDLAAAADALSAASLALEHGRCRVATDILSVLTESQRRTFHEMLASAKPPMPPGHPPEDAPDTGR